ncbi:hypothetical protein RJ639_003799 [Escallonia herrerae]|uniref:RRM domain-containing protein n=1 Tax=Escallonia herrerae TaxID=1293975 RepID=A0AA88W622_9ASTE|nr:hypothetical protein RJ639_003799 [Escallonia herrerae]
MPPRRSSRATAKEFPPTANLSAKFTANKSPAANNSLEAPTTTKTASVNSLDPTPFKSPPTHNSPETPTTAAATTTTAARLTSPNPIPLTREIAAGKIPSKATADNVSKEPSISTTSTPVTADATSDKLPEPPATSLTSTRIGASDAENLDEHVPPAPVNVVSDATVDANADNCGTKTGAKTIVKRMRMVKKIVKKKVRKAAQNEESVVLEVLNNVERPTLSFSNAVLEVQTHNPVTSVSIDVENPNPSDNNVSVLVETPKLSDSVAVEAENLESKVNVLLDNGAANSIEVEKTGSDANVSTTVENPEEPQKCESKRARISDEIRLEEQMMGLAEEKSSEGKPGYCGMEGGEAEGGQNGAIEDSEAGDVKGEVLLHDGVLLSGEMEALERRRRRKTEIFIGGLDKDTKEADIRKVFEEVGEISEVRLLVNAKTGKNKGFAFVRYSSAADAKKALTKYHTVEICGKQCGTSPVEGNDTIFLGHVDKKWKSEDVDKLLKGVGIEKIDKVTVKADPNNVEFNRGFAFVEFETNKDAQNAFYKLQKKDVFGKHMKIKVQWAEPLIEPDDEELLKVKAVYAEYLPLSWDEEKVRDYFKKFGEIESVVLAKDLRSSRRKDFAFVNYATREAALACIEALSHNEFPDEGSKINVKVSLAKPIPRGKQVKHAPKPIIKERPKEKWTVTHTFVQPHEPRSTRRASSSNYDSIVVDRRSSTTSELVGLLREQASWRQTQPALNTGFGACNVKFLIILVKA